MSLSFPRTDDYGIADDVFCTINGELAICPGENGYFQSYPVSRRTIIDEDKDLFNLYRRVSGYLDKECYSMISETDKDTWSGEDYTNYILYREYGVRGDDKIKWNQARGYFITTGGNGINQSCLSDRDIRTTHIINGKAVTIGFNKGLPDMPIISAGVDLALNTYPMADEKIYWGDGVFKISTGPDGISNSFAMGDDLLDIFMGTGRPDYPCVRSADGIADTYAQRNDRQLYSPGDPLDPLDNEITGFDAFSVWGPKALSANGKIYLYYSALGWNEIPKSFRDGKGSLGDLGECRRAGLDNEWGKAKQVLDLASPIRADSLFKYEFDLREWEFRKLLDNNQGVAIAPRIGLASSTIGRLRADPTDWDFRDKPVLDLGQQCAGSISFPISLPISLPGLIPDTNWNGAYSPDVKLTTASDGESPLFLMFFTGLSSSEPAPTDVGYQIPQSQVGLARSLDGVNWELVRDINPLVALPDFNLAVITGGQGPDYADPSVVNAGADEYGNLMYGMFFDQFLSNAGKGPGWDSSANYDLKTEAHIGYAIRKGKISLSSCSINSDYGLDSSRRLRSILQVVIMAVPLLLVFSVRLFRRRQT
jgi:hypothetical protein